MESDGDLDHAGGEGNNSIKRFLTDIKGEEAISTSSNRCRELDCLRAYYYLAVLEFLHEAQRAEEVVGSPGATRAAEVFGSAQENDSLDGEPTSEGSSSGSNKQGVCAPPSPSDSNQEDHGGCEDAPHSGSEDLDQNGKLGLAQTPIGKETIHSKTKKSPGADKAKSASDQICDDSVKKTDHGSTTSISGSKSLADSESGASILPFSATKTQGSGPESLSLDSSVDPPPVSSSEVPQSKDPQKLAHPHPGSGPLNPKSHATPTSLSPTGQLSPKKPNVTLSPQSISSHHSSVSPRNQASSSSSRQTSPSHHITSIASSPQTPASRSSTASTSGLGRRGELNKDILMRLSRGLLWDSQAKSEVLTETLGYIHKAISQHLLANRTPDTPTSDNVTVATAAESGSLGAERLSDAEGSTSASPVKSPGSAPKTGSSASPAAAMEYAVKTSPSLSATMTTTVQPQSDSLEEDGSVQQRRMTTPSVSPQQADHSSSGAKAKDNSPIKSEPTQQQLSLSGSAAVCSKSPVQLPSKPAQLPRSVSASTSPVSASSPQTAAAAKQSSTPRGTARSLSESHASPSGKSPTASGFDRAIGLKAERDLLGELAGEPISFSNSKKVCSGS